MWGRIQIVMVIVAIVFIASVLELIRRRRIKEEYSLLWLLAGVVVLTLSIFRSFLEDVAAAMGIYYAPSAMFLVAGLLGMALGLHVTAVISRLSDQNRILAERLALLEHAVERVAAGDVPSGREPGRTETPDRS